MAAFDLVPGMRQHNDTPEDQVFILPAGKTAVLYSAVGTSFGQAEASEIEDCTIILAPGQSIRRV